MIGENSKEEHISDLLSEDDASSQSYLQNEILETQSAEFGKHLMEDVKLTGQGVSSTEYRSSDRGV